MRYEWDEGKRAANFAKHGTDFCEAEHFDWQTAVEARDTRFDYGKERWIALGVVSVEFIRHKQLHNGEERWIALGMIGRRLHVLIYTIRQGAVRLISLRRANLREKRCYEKDKT